MKHTKLSTRILSLALTMTMLFGVMPTTALATEREPNGAIAQGQVKTAVTRARGLDLQGYASVTDKDGKKLISDSAGVYDMTESEGWKFDTKTNTLTLNGLNLEAQTSDGFALAMSYSKFKINPTIVLEGENHIKNAEASAIMVGVGDLTIKGNGTLTIDAKSVCIFVSDKLFIEGGTLNLKSSGDSDAIYTQYSPIKNNEDINNDINISGGILNVVAEQGNAVYVEMGNINITGGTVTADAYYCGLITRAATGNINITGGKVVASSSKDGAIFASGDLAIENADVTATKAYYAGIRAVGNIEIDNSHVVTLGGTNDKGKGYHAMYTPKKLTISSSTVTANGDSAGIQANASIALKDSTIEANGKTAAGLTSPSITITGGVTRAKGTPSAVTGVVTAEGATVTGATEKFESGTTDVLTQSGTDPVVLKFDSKISFDTCGGTAIADADVDIDTDKITMPVNPTWGDYTFAGWYTDKNYTTVFINNNLTSNTTVYAKWTNGDKTVVTETLDFTEKETTDKLSTEGWAWNKETATLTLSGLTLNRTEAKPDEFGNEYGIILLEDFANTIVLTDGTVNTVDISRVVVDDSFAAAILSGTSITIKTSGKGTPGVLNAISANKSSISNIGIYGPYGVTIESGVITAKAGESTKEASIGIAADDGIIHIKGGTVTATGVKSDAKVIGEYGYLGGSFGLCADLVQIDDGTVNATGGEAVLSAGIIGGSNVILNGGNINAKGKVAAVASIVSGIVVDDITNTTVNGKTTKLGSHTVEDMEISTLVDEKDVAVKDAAIKFKAAYTGTNPLAPSIAKVTDKTVTLNTQTIKDETVEYGINIINSDDLDYTIKWQDSAEFTGLTPNEMYLFYARVKASTNHKSGATSEPTAVTTKTAPQDVSGTVKDSSNVAVVGAQIELKQGNNLVHGTTTNVAGEYTIPDVIAGIYSLVVTHGTPPNTVTITDTITVDATPVTADVKFLAGNKNTVVETTTGTPSISAGGMSALLNDTNIGTTLSDTEKVAVNAGGSVEIKVKADAKTSSEVAEDMGKIEAIATGKKIGTILDLSVLKTIIDKDANPITTGENLTSLADIIKITIETPIALQGKMWLSVYRVHDGKAQELSADETAGEYYEISDDGAYITLHVKNFSTYAFGYEVNSVTLSGGGSGATGAGDYAYDELVAINAGTKSGYTFDGWTASPDVVFANAASASTSFIMPDSAITVTANWKYSGGGSTTTYLNTINQPKNGNFSMTPLTPFYMQAVTITTNPDKGYEVDRVIVKDANGTSIDVTKNNSNSYTFAQPSGKVAIEVTYKLIGTSGTSDFTDINSNDWFYDAVIEATAKGWFSGTSETTFSPNTSTSRGMIATILHRMEGSPATVMSSFDDVIPNAYYANGVSWAQKHGIVTGYDNGNYGPNDNITREQMASILYRYAGFKGYDISKTSTLNEFTDANTISDYAKVSMAWAVKHELFSGKGNGILDPKASASRAEVAIILVRFADSFSK